MTLVGRTEERARLDEAWLEAAAGSGTTVLVSGEAGIGKTRLVEDLATRARQSGALVLTGRCIDLVGAGVPYLALADAFQALPGTPWRGDAPQRALELFTRVRQALAEAAKARPVLLVVEDLHWADLSTVDLLAFLARSVADQRTLLVWTYRTEEVGRDDAVLRMVHGLRQARRADVIELGPLPRADLLRLIPAVAAERAETIWLRSGGNPFYAEELAASGPGELREHLRDVLLRRTSALGDDTRRVLRIAAVAGHDLTHRLVARAAGLPPDRLRDALREAVERHVLVPDRAASAFRFRHALLAEAVQAALLPGEFEELHAQVAAALDDGPDTAGVIAQHWAAAGRAPEAVVASLRAAEAAEQAAGLAEAVAHLERALSLWDQVPSAEARTGSTRPELLARAAEHADDIGLGHRAADLARRAIALLDEDTDAVRVALLYERLGSYLFPIGERAAGIAACQRAVDLVPARPASPERVRVLGALGHAFMLSFRHAEARDVCEEAIAVATELGDPVRAYRAQDVLGLSLCYLGQPDEGFDLLTRACQRTPDRAAPERLIRPYVFLSDVCLLAGRLDEAADTARRGLRYVREIGHEPSVGNVLAANVAEALLGLGDWDGADEILTGATRLGGNYWTHFLHIWRAQLDTARGAFDQAREHLEAGAAARGEPSAAPYHAYATAELALWEDRRADAVAAITDGLSVSAAPYLTVRLCAIGLRAGEPLIDRAREAARAATATTVDAAAWLALAEAEVDPLRWGEAADAWRGRRRPYLAAYADWRHADALLAAGADPAEATGPARRAHGVAVRLRAEPLRREVEHLARWGRLHLDPPPAPAPAVPDPFGLTAREAEVLHLLGLGYTNRDIATELVISVKTASVHVTNILRKLNVSTRIQAAAFAKRSKAGAHDR